MLTGKFYSAYTRKKKKKGRSQSNNTNFLKNFFKKEKQTKSKGGKARTEINRPIKGKETGLVIKSPPTKKSSSPDW